MINNHSSFLIRNMRIKRILFLFIPSCVTLNIPNLKEKERKCDSLSVPTNVDERSFASKYTTATAKNKKKKQFHMWLPICLLYVEVLYLLINSEQRAIDNEKCTTRVNLLLLRISLRIKGDRRRWTIGITRPYDDAYYLHGHACIENVSVEFDMLSELNRQ